MPTLADIEATQPRAVRALRHGWQRRRLHHAYLVTGSNGRERAALAAAVAAALLCAARPDAALAACGACPGCRLTAAGSHPDLIAVVPDARGRIAVDVVRAAAARLALRAHGGGGKVVRIDAADALGAAAQNALLKTLEEPAGPATFLLGAPGPRCLLATVRSRCARLHLAAPAPAAATAALCAAGVPCAQAAPLAWRHGADATAAAPQVEALARTQTRLRDGLAPELPSTEVAAIAQELGGDAERYEHALLLLEMGLRDALAAHHGAPRAALTGCGIAVPAATAAAAVDRLRRTRRLQGLHLNRAMALESLLFTLAGQRP